MVSSEPIEKICWTTFFFLIANSQNFVKHKKRAKKTKYDLVYRSRKRYERSKPKIEKNPCGCLVIFWFGYLIFRDGPNKSTWIPYSINSRITIGLRIKIHFVLCKYNNIAYHLIPSGVAIAISKFWAEKTGTPLIRPPPTFFFSFRSLLAAFTCNKKDYQSWSSCIFSESWMD